VQRLSGGALVCLAITKRVPDAAAAPNAGLAGMMSSVAGGAMASRL
jgi:hypothetical protein